MPLAILLLLVIAPPLALGAHLLLKGLPRTRHCPLCAGETFRLRSWPHRAASRLVRDGELQRRWCPECGWLGAARIRHPPAGAVAAAITGAARHVLDTRRAADSVDIRRLAVDGRDVRVMVQCWAEDGAWLGRLLFIDADGRTWTESACSIRGRSALDVLSQALTLPDRALAGRIRRVIQRP